MDLPIESQGVQDTTGELHYQDILVFKAMSTGYNGRGAGRIHISFTVISCSFNLYTWFL